jgi:flagellar biosynthetic protein FliQ
VSEGALLAIVGQALLLLVKVAGPFLAVSLVVGLLVSIFQSLTQIQDYTLTFAPKALALALVMVVAGHWIIAQLVSYTDTLYLGIPKLIAGA